MGWGPWAGGSGAAPACSVGTGQTFRGLTPAWAPKVPGSGGQATWHCYGYQLRDLISSLPPTLVCVCLGPWEQRCEGMATWVLLGVGAPGGRRSWGEAPLTQSKQFWGPCLSAPLWPPPDQPSLHPSPAGHPSTPQSPCRCCSLRMKHFSS